MNLYRPTGRYEDLLMMLARAETRRSPAALPSKSRLRRWLVEPPFVALGRGLCLLARALPAGASWSMQDFLFRAALAGKPPIPFDASAPALLRGAGLARRAAELTGREPALVALMAHPPVDADSLHLNVELMRHGLRGLMRARARSCRPRLVLAVDAFALDMLASHEEGAYAGFMGPLHLGLDRIPGERTAPARALLRAAAWTSIAPRIGRWLRGGGEMLMVPGGGVAATARVYYTAREAMGRLCREGPGARDPAAASRRLAARAAGYAAFLRNGAHPRSAWRAMEGWLLSILTGPDAYADACEGRLAGEARAAFLAAAEALGWEDREAARRLEDFEREFAREEPFRARLFAFLSDRVTGCGRPVVFLPLRIAKGPAPSVVFEEPAAWLSAAGTAHARRVLVLEHGGKPKDVPVAEFTRTFTESRFGPRRGRQPPLDP